MTTSLSRGHSVSLTQDQPALDGVRVGLGWQAPEADPAYDLDASAILLDNEGKALSDGHFVFFNNLESVDGSVTLERRPENPESPVSEADQTGDQANLWIELAQVPGECQRIVLAVSIYDAEAREQTFGEVTGEYVRVSDATGTELARYDLHEEASVQTGVVFGELYRSGGDWKLLASGQGYASGLRGIAADFGVNV